MARQSPRNHLRSVPDTGMAWFVGDITPSMIGPLSKQRRAPKFGKFPKPPESAEVRYAKARPELKAKCLGELTRIVIDTAAWQEVMVPLLDEIDAEWSASRKGRGATRYTAHQLEYVHLYGHLGGLPSNAKTRDHLCSDRGKAGRRLLGFEDSKPRFGGMKAVLTDGVPSEASLCRHRKRFPEAERAAAYRRLFERMIEEHFEEFPEQMREEARQLDLDGTLLESYFTSPILEKLPDGVRRSEFIGPRDCVNRDQVTFWEGGQIPQSHSNQSHYGNGLADVTVTTATGLPLASTVAPYNDSEIDLALGVIDELGRRVFPKLDPEQVRVLTADSGFAGGRLRAVARKYGIVENTHKTSHANRATSKAEAARRNEVRYLIRGHRHWFANGHYELVCECGNFTLHNHVKHLADGSLSVAIEGRCKSGDCGNIHIVSGEWRLAQNPSQMVRMRPGDPDSKRAWRFGNPLSFNGKIARVYGRGRFGHQEGFYGALGTRFKLTEHKLRVRTRAQAEIRLYAVYAGMHAIAMEQRRLEALRTPSAPPAPTPLPAPAAPAAAPAIAAPSRRAA
jgi:hypothetical protein